MLASIACHDMEPLQALFQASPAVIPVSCSQEALASFDWSMFLSSESQEFLTSSLTTHHHQDVYAQQPQHIESFETFASLSTTMAGHPPPHTQKASRASVPQRVPQNPNEVMTDAIPVLTSPNTDRATRTRRRVRFSNVLSIRSHDIILGEHPSCQGGMAIELDWTYHDEVVDLERFEQASRKRPAAQLRMSYIARRERIMEATGWTGAALLHQEYLMITRSEDTSSCNMLHNSPSVERALMAAQGLEEGYESII